MMARRAYMNLQRKSEIIKRCKVFIKCLDQAYSAFHKPECTLLNLITLAVRPSGSLASLNTYAHSSVSNSFSPNVLTFISRRSFPTSSTHLNLHLAILLLPSRLLPILSTPLPLLGFSTIRLFYGVEFVRLKLQPGDPFVSGVSTLTRLAWETLQQQRYRPHSDQDHLTTQAPPLSQRVITSVG